MNVTGTTNDLVTVAFSRKEFGILYGLMVEMTEQWDRLDEAAISVSEKEAKEIEKQLRQIAKSLVRPGMQQARPAA